MAQNVSVSLTKLRNWIVDGAVGTVNRFHRKNVDTCIEDIVNALTVMPGGAAITGATIRPFSGYNYKFAPVTTDNDGLLVDTDLGATTLVINKGEGGLVDPDFPRVITVKGNVSGLVKHVLFEGTDFAGAAITDDITMNGASAVESLRAFRTITKITLPALTHTGRKQQETATANGTLSAASGTVSVTIIAAGMTGTGVPKLIPTTTGDSASVWAGKVRDALSIDANVLAMFNVSGETTAIILTRKTEEADDGTLNIALANGTSTGVITAGTSVDTVTGVVHDRVRVGFVNKFGLPKVLLNAGLLLVHFYDGSNDAGTVAIDVSLSKNIYPLAGTPDGENIVELSFLG